MTSQSFHIIWRLQAQIREQMSGPEILWYEKSILGCGLWSGLDCEIKGYNAQLLRPVLLLFRGKKIFLDFLWKHYSVSTEKLHNTFLIEKIDFWPRKSVKTSFFRAKNLSVNAWRSGPDICSLICGYELRFAFKYNFSSKKIAAYLHYSPRISTRLARYSKLTKVILSFVFLSKKMNKKFYSKSIFDCQ